MSFFNLPLNKDHQYIGQLYGSCSSLLLSEQIKQHDGLSVIVTSDMLEAEQIEKELQFFGHKNSIFHLPDLETLPYDTFSPHQDIISERLATLYHLTQASSGTFILPISSLIQRLPPVDYIKQQSFVIKLNQQLDLQQFKDGLVQQGYQAVHQVESHGEFAHRGSIIDIFPSGSETPYRIELFDDDIDTIRSFNIEDQCSIENVDEISLLPALEFPLDEAGISTFRQNFRNTFDIDPRTCSLYEDISQGFASPGIEYYLPLFFDQTDDLFNYLPRSARFYFSPKASEGNEVFYTQINERYEQRRYNIERPILEPNAIFLSPEDYQQQLNNYHCTFLQSNKLSDTNKTNKQNLNCTSPEKLTVNKQSDNPLEALLNYLGNNTDKKILFSAETLGRREFLLEMLRNHRILPKAVETWQQFQNAEDTQICISVTPLERGINTSINNSVVICENQLFGEIVKQSRRKKYKTTRDAESIVHNLTDLREGAPVVHEDHGVGRYLGLETMNVGDMTMEFLCIEYAKNDKLYVPVSSLHLISRYTGSSEENAPLHRLGGDQWQKICKKAREKIHDVAVELLEINARREAETGFAFELNQIEYQSFSSEFPFEETEDQEKAINAVVEDMLKAKPMDRIVCGDVGFGKTEVGMRAAFVCANAGKQVAILVPTTLLAQQHYQNFLDRFANWPFKIALLSRFTSTKDQKSIFKALEDGTMDMVIGTHKLLSDNIKYKDLGLAIIDEEHRFGVRHKEKIKSMRAAVDLLTLTATPIPRTLNMSLSGMRDLSIIASPPAQRHAIKTFVSQWNDDTIIEGAQRELKRGGQVYFLHNEVKTIQKTAGELQELLPNAVIAIAHGQMQEKELEQVMLDFYHHRIHILLATTIIESGIDVPNANTIFINRADKLGLAQLHQIRGRVGRSHHRAYAYLLTPHPKSMTKDAIKRLEAIESLEDLGVGFTLATHDLEIRGAGELLGSGQSGQIMEIGFSLYNELLERTVQSLKNNKNMDVDISVMRSSEINFHAPALIPEDYIIDVHRRLIEYKRIASAKTNEELRQLQMELIDRFGLLPDALKNLFQITEIKLYSSPLGIEKIDFGDQSGKITFNKNPSADPMKIIQLIQAKPTSYTFDGQNTLKLIYNSLDFEQKMQLLNETITKIT